MHFASLGTGPSDIAKSDMASHQSSTEQFLARRMMGTTLGFFASPAPHIPGFSVPSMVCMHGTWGTWKRADHPDTGLHRSVLLTMELFTSRSIVSQQLQTFTRLFLPWEVLKESTTSRAISLLAPLRGSLHCRYPWVSGEAQEALSLPEPSCWKLSTAVKSHWQRKREFDLAAWECPVDTARVKGNYQRW